MVPRERRTFRLSCTAPVVLKYSRDSAEHVWRYSCGLAADVSLEGAALLLPEPISPGSAIALAVLSPAPDGSSERLEIARRATVVWADETPVRRPSFRHGIKFADPDVDLLLRAWPGQRISE
jgi:hypothetical protein